jgi:hypothetical protein
MQCWRAGDYQVIDKGDSSDTVYQLCKTHVTLQKLADRLAVEKLAAGQALQEPEAADLPVGPTTMDALNRLETMLYDPNAQAVPPAIVVQEQSAETAAYGTTQVVEHKQQAAKQEAKQEPKKF